MNEVIYVGLDVHKDSTTICFYDYLENKALFIGKIETSARAIIRSIERCRSRVKYDSVRFESGYEAGGLSFHLAKQLNEAGYPCVVMAPDSIYDVTKKRRVKNDERDALTIARALAFGQFKSVEIPDDMDLDVREIIHLRRTYVDTLTKLKNTATALVLRYGYKYTKSTWTKKHLEWLKKVELSPYARTSLDSLISNIERLVEDVNFLDSVIEHASKEDRYREKVAHLRCFYGIDTLIAMSIVSEIGDFKRFPNAKSFVSFLGLMPGEKSSGSRNQNTSITKAGNKSVRTLLIEAAQRFTCNQPEYKTRRMREKQEGVDRKYVAYADRCNKRLFHKVKKQKADGRNTNKIKVAIAHELACFIWGMMTGNIE